jgi:unsaturated chondroitin disaccharide hydrolase
VRIAQPELLSFENRGAVQSIETLSAETLVPEIRRAVELAAEKTLRLDRRWNPQDGAPVFTVAGRYTARSWTQWTQGFQYGCGLLCFDMVGEQDLLTRARHNTVAHMSEHITHMGVHDHGFNNISTYGNLRRLMLEGRIAANDWELHFYELSLKSSGAVQAARWTNLADGLGYIHSFNGSHSLFIDTIRSLRICGLAHVLGHSLLGEQDKRISLLGRAMVHARTSAQYNIYWGEGRDSYDTPALRGRTVHEAIFNPASGAFRCPSSQQGYSPFTTWTRGLAWAILGYAEQLEFIQSLPESEFGHGDIPAKPETVAMLQQAACAASNFYLHQASALDGICYWDTGAPELHRLGDWKSRRADPYNDFEPVDSSASAIAAQGLIRLGHFLGDEGREYIQAGLTIAATLLQEPYLSTKPDHEGLLLQSIYHRPNGWDHIPATSKIPCNESSMWGDYHLLELLLLVTRIAEGRYYTFFDGQGAEKESATR